jgi:hypothetical protein
MKIEIVESQNEVIYLFDGDFNEHFSHRDVPIIDKPVTVFQLGRVRNFSSCGVRGWIFFVKRINERSQLIFRECSVTTIDQINMAPDSLGQGEVESFYAPYRCECGVEVNRLIDVKGCREYLDESSAPPFECEICSQTLEFDDLDESYFQFLIHIAARRGR